MLQSRVAEPVAKRNLAPLLPHDHGAYAMLLVPAIIGATVGLRTLTGTFELLPMLLLLVALLGGFFAYEPLDVLTKNNVNAAARQRALNWLLIYASLTALSGSSLLIFWQRWGLLPIAGLEAVPLVVYFLAKKERKQRSLPVRLVSIAGLVLSAPAAYYLVAGKLDGLAGGLWLASLVYFGATLFYVHSWFEAKKQLKADLPLVPAWLWRVSVLFLTLGGLSLALAVASGWLPATIGLAFVPLLVKLGLAFRKPPVNIPIKQLGLLEFSQSFVFALLVLLALATHP